MLVASSDVLEVEVELLDIMERSVKHDKATILIRGSLFTKVACGCDTAHALAKESRRRRDPETYWTPGPDRV